MMYPYGFYNRISKKYKFNLEVIKVRTCQNEGKY